MDKTWEEMTVDEKQEATFQKLMAPKDAEGNDMQFQSPEAQALYKARVARLKDAVQMKKTPDRVPTAIFPGMFPFHHAGITIEKAMYDYDACTSAFKQFIMEFQPDLNLGPETPGPGKFYEIMDYKLYQWPGHGVPPEHSYQAVEKDYMKADEYDLLIKDPSRYFTNHYLPRCFGTLEGFQMLPNFPGILEMYGVAGNFIPYALPPVQETYKKLFEAGAEALKWAMAMGTAGGELKSMGYINLFAAGFSKAPYDILSDTMRSTTGIMMDMYRQPDKLLEAMDVIVPIAIDMGIAAMRQNGNPFLFMPLHKAADGFMSDEQFLKFYWPPFRKVLMGLIDAGVIPVPALEGYWNSRLNVLQDLPKGKTMWMVDQSDIFEAKKTLGRVACLCGNVSSSMLLLSTPDEVKEYCRKLIDTVGEGGGFVMCNGAFFDEANPENIKAMIEATREYGVY